MTNKEWVDLLQKEFKVSRTTAKEMLHGLMTVKRYDNFIRQFQSSKNILNSIYGVQNTKYLDTDSIKVQEDDFIKFREDDNDD